MGMIALLGQHGQPQDMQRGLELIRFSADNADENAPQGAYVSFRSAHAQQVSYSFYHRFMVCFVLENFPKLPYPSIF